ncbi:MAG: hypothetical protein JO319_12325, partial [Acidobacteriaceae bacterium]|nr:hypothetical protein [Acidobacteriaceae bacterium]
MPRPLKGVAAPLAAWLILNGAPLTASFAFPLDAADSGFESGGDTPTANLNPVKPDVQPEPEACSSV